MSREIKIITTDDGSHSIFVPELNESYHSFHGAYRESIHVFMLYGLETWYMHNPETYPIRIFEVGFGTGLNAWLTLVWAEQYKVPVLYHTIEPFPLEKEIYSQLNYTEVDTSIYHYASYFKRLHAAPWNEGTVISEYFNMKKDNTTLEDAVLYPADLVFYDAFAPNKQPELWTKEILAKVIDSMNPGCTVQHLQCQSPTKTGFARARPAGRNPPRPSGQKRDGEGCQALGVIYFPSSPIIFFKKYLDIAVIAVRMDVSFFEFLKDHTAGFVDMLAIVVTALPKVFPYFHKIMGEFKFSDIQNPEFFDPRCIDQVSAVFNGKHFSKCRGVDSF
jgi:hypothetical protein